MLITVTYVYLPCLRSGSLTQLETKGGGFGIGFWPPVRGGWLTRWAAGG